MPLSSSPPIVSGSSSISNDLDIKVYSALEGRLDRQGKPIELINGFLPFQWEGLQHMTTCDQAVYYRWSTGTGKSLAIEGTILYRDFDLCFYVVKPNNLYDSLTKLKSHTHLDGRILSGTPARRDQILAEIDIAIENGEQPILIFNAEKFREDKEILKILVEGRRLLIIFDEMPTKYSNRATGLYRSTAEVLYTSYNTPQFGKNRGRKIFYPKKGQERAAEMFSVATSATPIIKSPEGFYNSVRLMHPGFLPSITDFNNLYVAARDDWGNIIAWRNLDHLAELAAPIIHQADKEKDERIRIQFPPKMPPETIYCDLDPNSQKLYNILQKEYSNIGLCSILDYTEILSAIGVFQMICSNPRAVLYSALDREESIEDDNPRGSEVALKLRELVGNDALFTDRDRYGKCIVSKMLQLRETIEGHDDKVLVFTSMNETLLPLISEWFSTWEIPHVNFHGGLTQKGRQSVLEAFREDPEIKVFLSSDAGSTSIDLPQASMVVHYDLPWSWATLKQRERHDRIDSIKDTLWNITLAVPGTIESRKAEVIDEKHTYHEAIFGETVIEEPVEVWSAKAGLLYLLTGERVVDTE